MGCNASRNFDSDSSNLVVTDPNPCAVLEATLSKEVYNSEGFLKQCGIRIVNEVDQASTHTLGAQTWNYSFVILGNLISHFEVCPSLHNYTVGFPLVHKMKDI